ncbi:MAG: hypothetical protein JWM11_3040 [Planctomycetaceae bacterium]|nr:hypothetical protein [Planctomycetaceae bacterium]
MHGITTWSDLLGGIGYGVRRLHNELVAGQFFIPRTVKNETIDLADKDRQSNYYLIWKGEVVQAKIRD